MTLQELKADLLADGIIGEVNAIVMAYLLNSERHKHRKRFGSQGSSHRQLGSTVRKNGIQSLKLLPTQDIE